MDPVFVLAGSAAFDRALSRSARDDLTVTAPPDVIWDHFRRPAGAVMSSHRTPSAKLRSPWMIAMFTISGEMLSHGSTCDGYIGDDAHNLLVSEAEADPPAMPSLRCAFIVRRIDGTAARSSWRHCKYSSFGKSATASSGHHTRARWPRCAPAGTKVRRSVTPLPLTCGTDPGRPNVIATASKASWKSPPRRRPRAASHGRNSQPEFSRVQVLRVNL